MGSELVGKKLKCLKMSFWALEKGVVKLMQKCLECGKVFEDDEIAHWRESRGEFWGFPAYETMSGCPHCRGDCDEAIKCDSCGQYFTLDELDENHLCEDCREDDEDYICLKLNI